MVFSHGAKARASMFLGLRGFHLILHSQQINLFRTRAIPTRARINIARERRATVLSLSPRLPLCMNFQNRLPSVQAHTCSESLASDVDQLKAHSRQRIGEAEACLRLVSSVPTQCLG